MPAFQKNLNSHTPILVASLILCWFIYLILFSQGVLCIHHVYECLNVDSLGNWDGHHFLQIAESGYIDNSEWAFFPLYPFSIRIIHFLLPIPLLYIGLFLNWLVTAIGLFFFYKLLSFDFKKTDSLWILGLFLGFPLSFFLIVAYSEALFFCLSVLVFYYYRKQQISITLFFLLLLMVTRMAGLAVFISILIDAYGHKKLTWKFFLPLIGILTFWSAGFLQTNHFLATFQAETNWQRLVTIPGFSVYNSLLVLIKEGISYQNYSLFGDLLLVLLSLVLLFKSYTHLSKLYWNYTFFSLLIPLSTSTFLSFPRFLVVIFPLFIAFYLMSNTISSFRFINTIIQTVFIVVGLLVLQLLFLTFLRGGWVA